MFLSIVPAFAFFGDYCLNIQEEIGQMTLSAGTYMSEKFLEHADDEVCDQVGFLKDEGKKLL